MDRRLSAHADLFIFAIGAVLVVIGQSLPYAMIPSGGVTKPAPLDFLLLAGAGVALLLARRRGLRWLAIGLSAATIALAGYLAVASLRAVPTWSAVFYEADGTPGPSTLVMTSGLLVAGAAVFLRALFIRAGRSH